MNNKPDVPPHVVVKFANMVFLLGMIYSVLFIVFSVSKIYNPASHVSLTFYIICILFGVVSAVAFGFGLKKLNDNLKVTLSLLLFTAVITFYGFETYLEFRKIGSYDSRTKSETLNDLRDSGVEAYPDINPNAFITSNGLTSKKNRVYPLAGSISNKTTIFCNEGGFWSIYKSDEYGFNNPKGLHKKNKVDIVLIGDSFTEGACVKPANSISAQLRQLDFNAISLGQGGSGPLIELAILKEYAEPLKPKIVLWLYYVNDLSDLENEMQSSLLRKYLNEDAYSQNLISRQKEIDGVVKNFMQVKVEMQKNTDEKEKNKWIRIINLLKLTKIRKMINLKPTTIALTDPFHKSIFRDILKKSNQMSSRMNGKMYFIYLPSFARYVTGKEDLNRDFVMQTVRELDIPIIDVHSEVFDPHPDPLHLFPFRMMGHYNSEGYKLISEVIGKRLETDGYVSINQKNKSVQVD